MGESTAMPSPDCAAVRPGRLSGPDHDAWPAERVFDDDATHADHLILALLGGPGAEQQRRTEALDGQTAAPVADELAAQGLEGGRFGGFIDGHGHLRCVEISAVLKIQHTEMGRRVNRRFWGVGAESA